MGTGAAAALPHAYAMMAPHFSNPFEPDTTSVAPPAPPAAPAAPAAPTFDPFAFGPPSVAFGAPSSTPIPPRPAAPLGSSAASSAASASRSDPFASISGVAAEGVAHEDRTRAKKDASVEEDKDDGQELTYEGLIKLQLADGLWASHAALRRILTALALPEFDGVPQNVLITCLALALLWARFADRRKQWRMMFSKAKKCLQNKYPDIPHDNIVERIATRL
eukprot:TRINITY_DN4390_c0_g1_i1.p1 TRINITY_DN4390_c0_g1~~TRINITY_DN4390_c0_g1_i1.p1  ORF type:complete len:221 (+),score=67.06 TRINITY_DN4390_c0_g1_i1:163-825(+)